MGLLDKIKSAKNFVTGGGAQVQLQLNGQAARGQTVPVLIRAQVAGAPLKVSKVYLLVRAREDVNMVIRNNGEKHEINESNESFSQEFPVNGPTELDADSQHEWTAEITLPTSAQATYRGHNTNHVWEFQAALDVRGNDPDSGWQELPVS